MSRNCQHWIDEKCSIGLFGGKPSPGVCEKHCKQRAPIPGFVRVTLPVAPPEKISAGPGDMLAGLIAAAGFKPTADCGCAAMRRKINAWGYLGCVRHRTEIVAFLIAQAGKAGVMLKSESVAGLVRAAIREGWKRRLSV